jgi:hypothetical protein
MAEEHISKNNSAPPLNPQKCTPYVPSGSDGERHDFQSVANLTRDHTGHGCDPARIPTEQAGQGAIKDGRFAGRPLRLGPRKSKGACAARRPGAPCLP